MLRGDDKAAFAARLEDLAKSRGDARAAAKLAKLKLPPLGVAVVSAPRPHDVQRAVRGCPARAGIGPGRQMAL